MGKIEMKIKFPLDNDGFFRRECPFCNREFKIMIEESEKRDIVSKADRFVYDQFRISWGGSRRKEGRR